MISCVKHMDFEAIMAWKQHTGRHLRLVLAGVMAGVQIEPIHLQNRLLVNIHVLYVHINKLYYSTLTGFKEKVGA